MDIEKIIREYIKDVIHLSLSTSKNNIPWTSEVHFAYDENLNLYFVSRETRRHSIEIKNNNLVSGNIVKQHAVGEKVRGVYFEGECEELGNVDHQSPAYMSLKLRLDIGDHLLKEQHEEGGHRFYKIAVNKFYLFDELEMDPAGKYELEWKH